MFSALLLLSASFGAAGQTLDTQLILESRRRVIRFGSDAECDLIIKGRAVQSIFQNVQGILVPFDAAVFKHTFKFTPSRLGIVEVGPFSLSFMNRTLTSNRLKIKVLNERTEGAGFDLVLADDEVRLGETTQLVVEQFYYDSRQTVRWYRYLKSNNQMEIHSGQSFSHISIGSGRRIQCDGEVFFITPKVRGRITIAKENLADLPNSVIFAPTYLMVK